MIIGIVKNNMNLDLDEKIVLVTGGTSGIGLAIVKLFLEENACVIVLVVK